MMRHQMSIEKMEMKRIDDEKTRQKQSAEDDLFKTISEMESKTIAHDKGEKQNSVSEETSMIINQHGYTSSPLPTVRLPSILKFKHTPRFFKTPMRESTQLQEAAFLIKNRPFLKANKYFNTETSNLEETDPVWLKKKGDHFFEGEDYLAAINAYSAAIDRDQTAFKAYMNRSLCYLIVEEPHLCIHDCLNALDIIKSNADEISSQEMDDMRTKLLIRMSSAHSKIGDIANVKLALSNLQDAALINPSCQSIKCDVDRMARFLKGLDIKVQADIAFGNNKLGLSLDLYNQAIAQDSALLEAYSNRSAVYLYETEYQHCIDDCNFVLRTLRESPFASSKIFRTALIGGIPPKGSQTRINMVKVCLFRL